MRYILWLSVAIMCGTYICGPLVDPDLWWHITAGKWMLAHGEVVRVEQWNMFASGEPWRAYSWTTELLFAWVDKHFELLGLFLLKVGFGVALSLGMFYCMGRIADDWFFGTLLGTFTTASFFSHFTLRPQSLVWLFFALLLLLADRITKRGLSWQYVLGLFGVMVLWANTHITSALGIFAVAAWSFVGDKSKVNWKLTASIVLACFLGTLVTPYLGGEWITLVSKVSHPLAHTSVAEFRPPNLFDYVAAFLIISAAVFLFFLHRRPNCLDYGKTCLGAVFIFLGFAVVKFIPFSVVVLCSLIAKMWSERANDRVVSFGHIAEAIERLRALIQKIPREGLSFVVVVLAYLTLYSLLQAPLAVDVVPVADVDFMQEHSLPPPFLNVFGEGGYLMYRYSDFRGEPGVKIAIDGRTNVAPPEIFEQHENAMRGNLRWKEFLDTVEPKTVLWRNNWPMTSILVSDPEWCLVMQNGNEDQGHSVFLRRDVYQASYRDKLSC
mgnify:CR=1 FL=1